MLKWKFAHAQMKAYASSSKNVHFLNSKLKRAHVQVTNGNSTPQMKVSQPNEFVYIVRMEQSLSDHENHQLSGESGEVATLYRGEGPTSLIYVMVLMQILQGASGYKELQKHPM